MVASARRAIGANQLRLLDLPAELLQLVARFAYENDTGFAFASRATMEATAQPLGLDSFFAICAHGALARIARRASLEEQLFLRLRLVQRAMEAGNDAELFVWPAEAIDGPRPSPLREHPWDANRCSVPKGTQHSMPMEHNLHVGLDHPDPTGEFERRHAVDSVTLWNRNGYEIDNDADALSGVFISIANGKLVQAYGRNAYCEDLFFVNVRGSRAWMMKSALRRLAIRLLPNAF